MRAIFSSISVVGLFFLLAGCGSADSNTGSVDSIDAGQTVKTSSTKTERQSIFVGTIHLPERLGGQQGHQPDSPHLHRPHA